jgi:regulatory protein
MVKNENKRLIFTQQKMQPMLGNKDLTAQIFHYCNYQERCHKEVRNKLYELGAAKHEVEQLIVVLIENDLLHEERFACSFARGKFRLKQWGRNKIIQHLKLLQISDYCIRQAMREIDAEEYGHTLQRLAEKKWEEQAAEKNLYARKNKVCRYLLQKGYEYEHIRNALQELNTAQTDR